MGLETSQISRSPGFYSLTVHALDRSKTRNIDRGVICETIKQGQIKNSHKEDCCLFVHELWWSEYPIAVIANYKTGEILTVEHRK